LTDRSRYAVILDRLVIKSEDNLLAFDDVVRCGISKDQQGVIIVSNKLNWAKQGRSWQEVKEINPDIESGDDLDKAIDPFFNKSSIDLDFQAIINDQEQTRFPDNFKRLASGGTIDFKPEYASERSRPNEFSGIVALFKTPSFKEEEASKDVIFGEDSEDEAGVVTTEVAGVAPVPAPEAEEQVWDFIPAGQSNQIPGDACGFIVPDGLFFWLIDTTLSGKIVELTEGHGATPKQVEHAKKLGQLYLEVDDNSPLIINKECPHYHMPLFVADAVDFSSLEEFNEKHPRYISKYILLSDGGPARDFIGKKVTLSSVVLKGLFADQITETWDPDHFCEIDADDPYVIELAP